MLGIPSLVKSLFSGTLPSTNPSYLRNCEILFPMPGETSVFYLVLSLCYNLETVSKSKATENEEFASCISYL